MRSSRTDTFARLRGIPLRSLHTSTRCAWVFGRPPSEMQRKIFCKQGSVPNPWDISARETGSRRVFDLDPHTNRNPPQSCGALRELFHAQQGHREFRAGSWRDLSCQEAIRPRWASGLAQSSSPTGTHDRQKCNPPVFYPRLSVRTWRIGFLFGLGVQFGLGVRDDDLDDQLRGGGGGLRNKDSVSRQCLTV